MKRIAFLLAIILLVTSGSVFAQYDNTLKETDNINEQLISYLLSDKDFSEDEKITRGRFLEAVVTLMGKGAIINTNGPFSDVEEDTYLSYCTYFASELKIIAKNPTFNPDEEIKLVDALTIMVRALGYASIADNMGGYPSGNRALANSLGLMRDVTESESLSLKTAYTLLFNMMDCELMLGGSRNGKTFLKELYSIEKVEGIVNANEFSYLSDSSKKLDENKIMIGINEFIYENDPNLLGHYIEGFYKEYDGERRIVVLSDKKTDTVTFSGRDVEDFDGSTITIEINEKRKKYRVRKSFDYLVGGKASTSGSFSTLLANEELSIELIDNNSDGKYDVVSIDKWQYCHIYSIDPVDKVILDRNDQSNTIDLSKDECVYHIYQNEEGEIKEISLSDLTPEMLIACSSSYDQLLQKIIVCDSEKNAVIKSIDTVEEKIEIEEETLFLSKYAQTYMNILPGMECLILLGVNGEVVVVNQESPNMQYGWVVKAKTDRKTDTHTIKIFNQMGQMVTYTIAQKIRIDGEKTYLGNTVSPEFVVNFYKTTATDAERFVKFKIDASGNVKNIDLPATFSGTKPYAERDGSENDDFTLYFDGTYKYKKGGGFVPKFGVSGTIVFAIPKDEGDRDDDDNYNVTQPSSVFTNDDSYNVKAYDCTESSTPKVLLYFSDTSGVGVNLYEMMPAVVIKKARALDPDDNICTTILVECGGSYHTLYSNEKTEATINSLEKGDIIRYSAVKNNIVTAVALDYRFKDDSILNGSSGGLLEYNKGIVYSYGNGVVNILENKKKVSGSISLDDIRCIPFGGGMSISFVYVNGVRSDGTANNVMVRPTPGEKLTDYIHGGNRASYAIIRQRYDEGKYMIVYVAE